MNVSPVITKEYVKKTLGERGKNEPKTNPNEPKFKKAKMNVNKVLTKDYENISNWAICENEPNTKPKQTQTNPKRTQNEPKTNPNEPKFKKAKMNVTSYITKEYENISNWAICENEPNTKPKQTQTNPMLARHAVWQGLSAISVAGQRQKNAANLYSVRSS